ncbi:UDP-glucose dehydrogenase family protein [Paenibacillus cremeus]|uniref:UDP-glucose 6-dehydrogenase n=1 Tax=Paenibacillus cremeus TaxID=2163881 RepID=A0A559K9C4_9BACL|nr:UDP-glucose/GDP-mannose dehydrogenase family protein [Paenibacillus cremeus]TVY08735.1 UDP-glucose/GDP-mannose dehydrogenase family protein [Paenibacillus cremeus]
MRRENIAVIGTGYVGLVSGTCFAEIGHQAIAVDRDQSKIERLRQADIPIYEPGLEALVRSNMEAGRLSFTSELQEAVRRSDILFLAVGTPSMPGGEVDLSYLESAFRQLAAAVDRYKLIVIKSTVPVGTAAMAEGWLREEGVEEGRFDIVSNPEFLREGSAIHDTFHSDRIVIGAEDQQAAERIAALHAPLQAPVLFTDRASAELIKYASNAFLAAKISFINEMANVCEKVGADIALVAQGMGMDKRIGSHFLQAGIGYGGSCFPKDTKAQLRIAEDVDYDFKILRSVIEVNALQRERFADRIIQELTEAGGGKAVAVMGLAFKPNTDDLRDAPALDIIEALTTSGVQVRAYDPVALEKASAHMGRHELVTFHADPYEAVAGADAMVITTEWEAVKSLDFGEVARLLSQRLLIDGRNCLEPAAMAELGFRYVSVGRA